MSSLGCNQGHVYLHYCPKILINKTIKIKLLNNFNDHPQRINTKKANYNYVKALKKYFKLCIG